MVKKTTFYSYTTLQPEKKAPIWDSQGFTYSFSDNLLVRCPTDRLNPESRKELLHALVTTRSPKLDIKNETVLSKEGTTHLLDFMQVPNKLRRKCGSVLHTLNRGQYKRLCLDTVPWELIWAVSPAQRSPLHLLNNQPLDPNVRIVTPISANCELIRKAAWAQGGVQPITLDIETFGWDKGNEDGLVPWKGDIRSIQIAFGDSPTCWVLDLGPRWDRKPSDEVGKLLNEILPGSTVWGHNLKFDLLWLKVKFGLDLSTITCEDSWVLSKVLWSGIKQYTHTLNKVAARVGVECHDKTLQKADFGGYLLPAHYNYGAYDVFTTREVVMRLQRQLQGIKAVTDQTHRLLVVTTEMNQRGMPVDAELVSRDLTSARTRWSELEELLKEELGVKNPSSPKQLKEALDERWGLNGTLPNASAPVIRAYEPDIVIDWIREFNTLGIAIACGEGILSSVTDGYAHTQYSPLNTQASGRVSCSKYGKNFGFNGLNISRPNTEWETIPNMRRWFTAPRGRRLVGCDASGSHLKIALEASGQLDVLERMTSGSDGHSHTTVAISNELFGPDGPYSTLDRYYAARERGDVKVNDLRMLAKTAIYSLINICSGKSLKASLSKDGIQIPLEDAGKVVDALWTQLPRVNTYVRSVASKARKGNYLKDLKYCMKPFKTVDEWENYASTGRPFRPIGWAKIWAPIIMRYRYLPVYQRLSRNGALYESISLSEVAGCLWAPVESYLMINAAHRFYKEVQRGKPHLDAHLVGFVYDELIVDVAEEYAREAATLLGDILNECWSEVLRGTCVTSEIQDRIGLTWDDIH